MLYEVEEQTKPEVETGKIDYQDQDEKISSDLQVAFEEVLAKSQYGRPTAYKNVAVLSLRWDDEHDDLGVLDEVKRLEDVLEHEFSFEITSRSIQCLERTNVQLEVNHIMAEWVHKNDHLDNLLIVYYAGHGEPGPSGQLILKK